MSGKVIIAAIAGVVIVGAGIAGFVVVQNKDENQSANVTSTNTNQVPGNQSEAQQTNIDALIAQGATQKCSFSSADGEQTSSGTMYFSNKRMRGDFTTVTTEKTVDGSMIISDGMQYFWDKTSKQGVKLAITQQQAESSQQKTVQALDPKKNFEFKCGEWSLDESVFTPPSDVTLTDLSNVQSLQDIRTSQ